jgi:hypothetical protein
MKAKKAEKKIGNEKGLVLVVALLLITVLILLSSTAVTTTTTDMKIAGNYREGVKALYDAEAGIHYTIGLIKSSTITLPTTLNVPTTPTITLPTGFSFSGIALTNLGSNRYRLSASGNAAVGARKGLEVILTMASSIPPGADGALAMYGGGSVVELKSGAGGGYNVDGHNYPLPANFNCSGSACQTAGSDTGSRTGLYAAVTPTITGNAAAHIGGHPSPTQIGGTSLYTNQTWSNFVDNIIANQLYVTATPGGSLGTREAPQITRIVVGEGTQSSITGNTPGAGILIVDGGGEFTLSGTSHFEGLIILRGSGALQGSGTADVFGSVITIDHANRDINLNGTVDLVYSSQALANLANISSLQTISVKSWKDTSLD